MRTFQEEFRRIPVRLGEVFEILKPLKEVLLAVLVQAGALNGEIIAPKLISQSLVPIQLERKIQRRGMFGDQEHAIDYYSAPNCSAVCPNGGTPKANGTQDCSCVTTTKVTLVAGTRKNFNHGYGDGSYGSLTPNTYRGVKITKFYTYSFLGKWTRLYFESTNNIPNTLKIKINDTVYDFVKEDNYWKNSAAIFSSGKTYTIEFLN